MQILHHGILLLLFLCPLESFVFTRGKFDPRRLNTWYHNPESNFNRRSKPFENDKDWLLPNYDLLKENPTYYPKGYKIKWELEKDERTLRRCQMRHERNDDKDNGHYELESQVGLFPTIFNFNNQSFSRCTCCNKLNGVVLEEPSLGLHRKYDTVNMTP